MNRISCIALAAAWGLALQFSQGCDYKTEKLGIGREAPDFTYLDLDQKTRTLTEHRGRVVLLRFWADWCPPCAAEFPIIERAYQEMKDKGLDVVAVNVRQPEARVKDYIRRLELSHIIALDRNGKISGKYGIKGLPMNFVIDRRGVIREVIISTISDLDMLKQFVAPYL